MTDIPQSRGFYDDENRYMPTLADFTSGGAPRSVRNARQGFRAPGFYSMGVDTTGNLVAPPPASPTDETGGRSAAAALRSMFVPREDSGGAGNPTGVQTKDAPPDQRFGDWAWNAARGLTNPAGYTATQIAKSEIETPGTALSRARDQTELALRDPAGYLSGSYEGVTADGRKSSAKEGERGYGDDTSVFPGNPGPAPTEGGGQPGSVEGRDPTTGVGAPDPTTGEGGRGVGGDTGVGNDGGGNSGGASDSGAGDPGANGGPSGPWRKGGLIPKRRDTVRGPDDQVITAKSGEFVQRPEAVKKYGVPAMAAVNAGRAKITLPSKNAATKGKPVAGPKRNVLSGIRAKRK